LFSESRPIFRFSHSLKYCSDDSFHNYLGKNLIFNPDTEMLLRKWLNKPKCELTLTHWKMEVDHHAEQFPGEITRLRAKKIIVTGKSFEGVIQGFIKIKAYLHEELTLRNLSAKCFWQNSKFLDHRQDMLEQLYPQLKIKPRVVLVNVYLPPTVEGVLFIENLDSYHQAIQGIPEAAKNLALVYSAGFKLSAQRIRDKKGVSLHFHHVSHVQRQFTVWWHTSIIGSDTEWPVYFWGDLDYAGMEILKNLKQRFINMSAWQPGYQPMLQLLLDGEGHTPEMTGKQKQEDKGDTGCQYADTQLTPVMRETGCFVDQECVT